MNLHRHDLSFGETLFWVFAVMACCYLAAARAGVIP